MTSSLVGSEMCIRDSSFSFPSGTPSSKMIFRTTSGTFHRIAIGSNGIPALLLSGLTTYPYLFPS
eukprot:11680084-Prorocentrum_lima.AAC.1